MQNRNRLTDIKNKIMVSKEETSKGRLNQDYGINIQSTMHKIDNQDGLTVHSTWNCI